jgi:hypothetical protein
LVECGAAQADGKVCGMSHSRAQTILTPHRQQSGAFNHSHRVLPRAALRRGEARARMLPGMIRQIPPSTSRLACSSTDSVDRGSITILAHPLRARQRRGSGKGPSFRRALCDHR